MLLKCFIHFLPLLCCFGKLKCWVWYQLHTRVRGAAALHVVPWCCKSVIEVSLSIGVHLSPTFCCNSSADVGTTLIVALLRRCISRCVKVFPHLKHLCREVLGRRLRVLCDSNDSQLHSYLGSEGDGYQLSGRS